MKKDIHPIYFEKAHVACACGNKFTVGSTQEKIAIEICSACHPLYTGKEKIIDTAGRVERFKTRRTEAGKRQAIVTEKKKARAEKEAAKKIVKKAKKKL